MDLECRLMRIGDEDAVCRLIVDSFNEFIAPGYSDTGVKEFLKSANPQALKDSVKKNCFVLVALDGNQLIGVIRIRSNSHISLLFVKTEYHNIGIARKLLKLSLEICKKANPSLDYIDANSSPYAVEIYEKLGFIRTGVEQEVNGMKFIPMKLTCLHKGYHSLS